MARLDTGMLGDKVAFDEGMEEMRHRVGEALYSGKRVNKILESLLKQCFSF